MDLFDEDRNDEEKQPHTIKILQNGNSKLLCQIDIGPYEDDFWKVKKSLLKRLKFRNYKDRELQEEVRLFTMTGIDISHCDIDDLRLQHAIVFTVKDDFDYASRINALRFKRHLGQGGFGMVNLCTDEMNG